MGTINGMMAQARATLGLGESPLGSNHNKITVWYNANIMHIGDGAWCDMGVTYWAGHSDNLGAIFGGPGIGYAYTVYHARKFQAKSRWHYGTAGIRKGDVIFFNWDGRRVIDEIDHVGYVEKVSGGLIYTIEANTGDVCRRKVRDGKYVVGYGRPAYATAKPEPKPQPQEKEEDMPEYISLATATPVSLSSGKGHRVEWSKEWADTGDSHADTKAGKSYPGILSGGEHGTVFTLTVTVPEDLDWRFVETDPSKEYVVSKTYATHTGPFTENGWVNNKQHLYVELLPNKDRTALAAVKGSYWPQKG
jgi:hypothetical protein